MKSMGNNQVLIWCSVSPYLVIFSPLSSLTVLYKYMYDVTVALLLPGSLAFA